jgi:hypothetical protein
MNYLVKTHREGVIYKGPHFFVLNKGKNTGRLLNFPCANCWVIQCQTQEIKERLEIIVDAMHVTGRVRPSLIGSVIPFVHIAEFRKLLNVYSQVIGFEEKFTTRMEEIRRAKMLLERYQQERARLNLQLLLLNMKLLRGK